MFRYSSEIFVDTPILSSSVKSLYITRSRSLRPDSQTTRVSPDKRSRDPESILPLTGGPDLLSPLRRLEPRLTRFVEVFTGVSGQSKYLLGRGPTVLSAGSLCLLHVSTGLGGTPVSL